MAIQREFGAEQPAIKLGMFRLRLPFVHYRLELPECIQGLFIITVSMGAIAANEQVYGLPSDNFYQYGILMVSINTFLYLLHPTFGDPVFPGWITPAMPLVIAWSLGLSDDPVVRLQSIIALQIEMAIIFLFLGITGLGGQFVARVPKFMKGGIVLGSGFSAVTSCFKADGYVATAPIAIIVSTAICYLLMNADWVARAAKNNKVLAWIKSLGMTPGLVVGYIIGLWITKEIAAPVFEGGVVIPWGNYGHNLAHYTIFGVGFPPAFLWISAIPVCLMAYIIAYGDFVLAKQVAENAGKLRPDEKIIFNANRSHCIAGTRNLLMALFAPYSPLSGPLYAGGTFCVYERYKGGPEVMPSFWGGMLSFIIFNWIATMLYPLMQLFAPVRVLGLGTTIMVQAYGCGYVALGLLDSDEEKAMGFITGAVLCLKGAVWGLATGFILYFLVGYTKETRAKCKAEMEAEIAADKQMALDDKAAK